MQRTEQPDGFLLEDRLGSYVFRRIRPGSIEILFRGGMLEPAVPLLIEELAAEIARVGSLRFFVETTQVASYTSEFRKQWTSWLSDNKKRITEIHVLVTSRLVAMGVQLANIAMGGIINAHSDRARYEAALRGAAAQASASG